MNESEIVGDHVVVNATFADGLNVIRTELTFLDGFRFSTTRPLVIPEGIPFDPPWDPDFFDWIQINGLRRGMRINLTMHFTNGDSDLFGFPGEIPTEPFYLHDNALDMAGYDKPETDSIIWNSDSETMALACFNYEGTPGNWTLDLVAGFFTRYSTDGRTAVFDTYNLGRNSTVESSVIGHTSTNDTVVYNWTNVTFGNYFLPQITVNYPDHIGTYLFNITWSSCDLNADDLNLFEVWVSSNGGASYQLLGRNLTQTWFVWNATGFLSRDDYRYRVRAYSVDIVAYPGPFISIPFDYIPGDFADGYSPYFTPTGLPQVYFTDIYVNPAPDVTCQFGTSWNNITWTLDFNEGYEDPEMFIYVILLNDTFYEENEWKGGNEIVVFIDDLPVGNHRMSINYWNPGSSGGTVMDTVLVHVYTVEIPSPTIGIAFIGAGLGFGIVVGAYVVYIIKTRKPELDEPEESEENILSQLL
jgi:hypothetical protein